MLKLLVIGPDDQSLHLSGTVLWRPDIERAHVADAAEAVAVAARLQPNLVVLEARAVEPAAAVIQAIRSNPGSRPTAIAVLHAGLPLAAEEELLRAGANAVIPTPIDPFVWDRRLEELLSVPKRRAHRIPVRLRDWSFLVREAEETEGSVVNIGARGVLLETPRPLELGAKLGLTFRLPGEEREVNVVGQVVRPAGQVEGAWRNGVEFLIYRGDARQRIVAFVEEEASARPGAPGESLPLRLRGLDTAGEWEEELRASELRKTLILDSALDCIVTIDHDGRALEFNASARRLFGFTRADVFGRDLVEKIVRPQDRAPLRRLLREFVETGDTELLGRRLEAAAVRADGTELPIEVAVFPAWIKGKVLLTAFIRDLTRRKEQERMSALRHDVLQAMAEAASLEDALTRIAAKIGEALGLRSLRLALRGRRSAALQTAASWPAEAKPLGAGATEFEGPPPAATEVDGANARVPIPGTAGPVGLLELTGEGVKAPGERWLDVLEGIAVQIGLFAERHRAEEALRRTQASVAAVADAIPGAVFQYEVSLGGEGRLAFVSRGATDLFGMDLQTLRREGAPPWHLLTEERRLALQASIAAAGASQSPWEATFEVAGPVGPKWIHGQAVPAPLPAGGTVWNGILVDVSAQKEAEEQLRDANRDLDRRLVDLRQAEVELQRIARHDSLTGLPNRSYFMESLHRTLLRATRHDSRIGLVFIDVDGFKAVNDNLGHVAGDQLLRTLAERLRGSTRKSDLVARIGGDEFTVLVQDLARPQDVALVAQSLLDKIAKPCAIGEREVTVTASVGISVWPEDGGDAGTLLRHADLAMYRAKQEGKNTYRFFTPAMSARASERMQLQASLRQALEAEEFELHYQPVIHSGGPPSLEALVRWRRPGKGLLAPSEFIGAAEESGFVVPLGAWVLKAATRFASALARSDVRVAVNLSARQFLQADLVDTVESALRECGLPPHRLELEVTESVVMSDAEEVRERLDRLRSLGLQLALDDFGSGYSSLSYLKRFRFHRLKIDRTFVRDLPGDADSAAIVDAVLAMARSLGLEVIAEGVETEEQLRFLEARGCPAFQGFYFSRPLPADEVAAYLERGVVR